MTTRKDWLTFAGMLRGYRKDKGMTLSALGKAVGISDAYLCDLEQGRRNPSVRFVEKFVDRMEMSKSEGEIWHLLAARASGWKV